MGMTVRHVENKHYVAGSAEEAKGYGYGYAACVEENLFGFSELNIEEKNGAWVVEFTVTKTSYEMG